MKKNNLLDHVAHILMFLGALNWGLIAIFDGFNLIVTIFHQVPTFIKCSYILIAVAALYCMIRYFRENSK